MPEKSEDQVSSKDLINVLFVSEIFLWFFVYFINENFNVGLLGHSVLRNLLPQVPVADIDSDLVKFSWKSFHLKTSVSNHPN